MCEKCKTAAQFNYCRALKNKHIGNKQGGGRNDQLDNHIHRKDHKCNSMKGL